MWLGSLLSAALRRVMYLLRVSVYSKLGLAHKPDNPLLGGADKTDTMLKNDQVTIFGGSGFLGRYLVKRLANAGARLRVAVRDVNGAAFLKPMGDLGQIVPVATNVRDNAQVAAAVAGAYAVVNLLGILYEKGAQTFVSVHAEAPRRIAEAARSAGVERFVQISAIGADPDSPSRYAQTKGAGEAAAKTAFPEVTLVRPSVVFGSEDGFLNRFAALAPLTPILPLFGAGKTLFQPVYVGDVAAAVTRILEDPATKGLTYELGGPRTMSLREVFALVLRETRRRRLLLPLPMWVAEIQAFFLQLLPDPPLTPDQVTLLRSDNVVGEKALGLADLGISPTPVETIAPSYLARYRRGTRFAPLK